MAIRNIYLKIEEIKGYCPVLPEDHVAPPHIYGRDCMRNHGHMDGTIPLTEINARTLDALIYREYLDANYLIPKPDKLVINDINEPIFKSRVPGTVIYCFPGDKLYIHVLNWDTEPHTFHVHGLKYGIASDGSWPFGTQATDGSRSDEICPGKSWIYIYDVTDEMLGAWPFHDHHRNIGNSVNRGLFGGLIVLPKKNCHPPQKLLLPDYLQDFIEECCKRPVCKKHAHLHFHKDDTGAFHHVHPAMGAMEHQNGGHAETMRFEDPAIEHLYHELEEWAQLSYLQPYPKIDQELHVPIFFHFMQGMGTKPAFDSPDINPGGSFSFTFGSEVEYNYHCRFHSNMQGTVKVIMGGPATATVNIVEGAQFKFDPLIVPIGVGGVVTWNHNTGMMVHSVTEDAAGMPTYCINGRAFIGNTPTIVAHAGQKIRWYVFNLDLGMGWHNFHLHGQRWQFGNETIDIRSIGPAESFVVETVVPPVILLPPEIEACQHHDHRHKEAVEVRLKGDFLFHCHVEMHMMMGLAGLLRSRQSVWLTSAQKTLLENTIGLPYDTGSNACPDTDDHRCEDIICGRWEEVPGAPEKWMMHAILLPNTTKVLFYGYGDQPTDADLSRLWDYGAAPGYSIPANQPINVASTPGSIPLANLWSSEHAFIDSPEGKILIHGGFTPREAYIFNPANLVNPWSLTAPTSDPRFYSTSLTLGNGKILTMYGSLSYPPISTSIEIYNPATNNWEPPVAFPASFDYQYYPWTYQLPDGNLFIAGHQGVTRIFDPSAPVDDPAKTFNTISGQRSSGGEKGTSVLLPLRPPLYQPTVIIMGGDLNSTEDKAEIIDLSVAAPSWTSLPKLNVPRPMQVNSVLLPDGRVFLAGGVNGSGGPAELFDPQNPGAGWIMCAEMKYIRQYHSSAILLADGSVLMGGDYGIRTTAVPNPHERYYPAYFGMPRPAIGATPALVHYNDAINIDTPDAIDIKEVILIRPGAVTHGWNQSQRLIECEITAATAVQVKATIPANDNLLPPGYYLLFIVSNSRVPSVGKWIRVTH